MRKRAYRATTVKDVKISEVIARLAEGRICVGLDISKAEAFAVAGRIQSPILSPHWPATSNTAAIPMHRVAGNSIARKNLGAWISPRVFAAATIYGFLLCFEWF